MTGIFAPVKINAGHNILEGIYRFRAWAGTTRSGLKYANILNESIAGTAIDSKQSLSTARKRAERLTNTTSELIFHGAVDPAESIQACVKALETVKKGELTVNGRNLPETLRQLAYFQSRLGEEMAKNGFVLEAIQHYANSAHNFEMQAELLKNSSKNKHYATGAYSSAIHALEEIIVLTDKPDTPFSSDSARFEKERLKKLRGECCESLSVSKNGSLIQL